MMNPHLSGANNFDTIPTVNNNPLLLASSLPPDLARTGQANTFTQPQTFSIAPTIKDASTDKGDNQAATMADLKSVETSAWRIMTGSSEIVNPFSCLYRINIDQKRIEFILWGSAASVSSGYKATVIDFSSIVTGISSVNGKIFNAINASMHYSLASSGTKVIADDYFNDDNGFLLFVANDVYNTDNQPAYAYYTGLK